jgi:hypothetical protein
MFSDLQNGPKKNARTFCCPHRIYIQKAISGSGLICDEI